MYASHLADSLQLPRHDVHLWIADCHLPMDAQLLNRCAAVLSADERAQQARFHFEHDRHRYLVTRVLVRWVLSRYLRVAPGEWTFATNAHGRPHACNVEALDAGLRFNVSHTHGLVVLGVSCRREIGVDVECVSTQRPVADLAQAYFAPAEARAVAQAEPGQQHLRFYEYWTLKEAYVKARGLGLHLPLDRFAFSSDDAGALSVLFEPPLHDNGDRWHFWQLGLPINYLLAVCAERTQEPAALVVRRAVPMVAEACVDVPVIRASR